MGKIDWRPEKDRLVFLGDYIDRGVDSKGVVDYILNLKNLSSNVTCLLGNHEQCFMNYLHRQDIAPFLMNGGEKTLESYSIDDGDRIPDEHYHFFENLETMVELDEFYLVHAGFRPGVKLESQSLQDMLWIREPFIYSEYDFGKIVVFGHTSFSDPLLMDNKIGIDTGAVFGNKLTCLKIPDMEFFHAEAKFDWL